jgi:hypothetical protein
MPIARRWRRRTRCSAGTLTRGRHCGTGIANGCAAAAEAEVALVAVGAVLVTVLGSQE